MRRITTLAVALSATAATLTAVPGASATPPSPPPLQWKPCPQERPATAEAKGTGTGKAKGKGKAGAPGEFPPLECAKLAVPLDYADPADRQIEIAVSRLAGTKPERRRGVLLTNPGGPGIPGLGYPAVLAATGLPQKVRDTYDIIGFDPRGTGRSTPVSCGLTQEQQDRGNFPTYARTPGDVVREAGRARGIAERCAASPSAPVLPHIGTADTARDMDRLRAALGERRMSFLGASYGTHLGAVYASLFPGRGDRIVLDSSLGPGGYDAGAMRMLGRGMEERFPDFARYAAAHPRYGLGRTPREVRAKYFELARRLEREPAQGFDGTAFRGITFDRLYLDANMPELAALWQALDTGKPVPELPSSPDAEQFMSARFAVICGDAAWPRTLRAYQRGVAADRKRYPLLGGSTANIGPCAYWPRSWVKDPVRVSDRGPANILMVQNERDPGTPLAGAHAMRRALGKRAVLVTADQGGHGAYLYGGNGCADDAVTTYLTTGERPARDRACAAEPVTRGR
ncbi:alpha/beta hydrolase [Streptomyces sp. NPDC047123]|uniref:alpha/beta hydrolase n=1 Tax=Streptomyces sp. NPDC047123 TaxID=3155622 RepID=UPI0033F98BF3